MSDSPTRTGMRQRTVNQIMLMDNYGNEFSAVVMPWQPWSLNTFLQQHISFTDLLGCDLLGPHQKYVGC